MVNRSLATGALALAGLGLLSCFFVRPAGAQFTTPPPTHVQLQGPSAMELNLYGLQSWDRSILSARSKGMGGISLALPGASYSGSLNPAALSSLAAIELSAEARNRGGSASSPSFPSQITGDDGSAIEVTEYHPSTIGTYSYNDLALGVPVSLLNRRGGVALSYHRVMDFRSGEESRMKVKSPLGEADLGQGIEFHGGVDALTPSFGMNVTDNLSLGVSLNFMDGSITENGNQGVTVFGAVFSRGSLLFEQDVSGTSVDLGAQYKLGPRLKLGAALHPGYTLSFRRGFYSYQPLPTSQDPTKTTYVYERDLLDYTLSVPTMWGLGGSYDMMNGRLLLAAEYLYRPWSTATYKREAYGIVTLFPDTTALQNNLGLYVPNGSEVEKNANFIDTSHMRIGAEYKLKQGGPGHLNVPLRLGFRREPLTLANADPDSFNALVRAETTINSDPNLSLGEKQALIGGIVNELLQNGASLIQTDKAVEGTTISLGSGLEIGSFSLDVAYSRTSYTIDRLFFGSFSDLTLSPHPQQVTEKHTATELTIQTTLRF